MGKSIVAPFLTHGAYMIYLSALVSHNVTLGVTVDVQQTRTVLATEALQLCDHACGTVYLLICDR